MHVAETCIQADISIGEEQFPNQLDSIAKLNATDVCQKECWYKRRPSNCDKPNVYAIDGRRSVPNAVTAYQDHQKQPKDVF